MHTAKAAQTFKIHFIDVGCADAALLQYGEGTEAKYALIDKMYLFLSTVITLLPFLDERRVSSLTPLCVSFIYHLTSLLF